MKFQDIDALDQAIERTAKRIIKHYYTDWKNYDRPAYMGFKGAEEKEKKHILILFREMGSYIFSEWDFMDRKAPAEIINYYLNLESTRVNAYYFVDLERLTMTRAKEAEVARYIKGFEDRRKAA